VDIGFVRLVMGRHACVIMPAVEEFRFQDDPLGSKKRRVFDINVLVVQADVDDVMAVLPVLLPGESFDRGTVPSLDRADDRAPLPDGLFQVNYFDFPDLLC